MAVTTPCLCRREDVKRALDVMETARHNWQIDRAIQSAARNIEAHMHLKFHPTDATYYFDWPNFSYAYPWRLWFDQHFLAAPPTAVSTGTAGGTLTGVQIPVSACNVEPINSGPPYRYMELRRDLSYSFGAGPTPQRDVGVTGTFGFWLQTDPGGTIPASINSSATTAVVSDGSVVGVGDLLIVDTERMLVSDRSSNDSGQTNLTGLTTAAQADVVATVTDGTQLHVDEVIQIDGERMLIVDITGNQITVKRAWDGTVLATHSTGTHIYTFRTLTLLRGQLGTTAATHASNATVGVWRIPSLLRDLAVAESANRVLQETGGYRDPQGEGAAAMAHLGSALADLWDEAETLYGRKARIRVI
ncbi:hypothetical protein ABH931_006153 [Streptacidiphilus sp. MAP12-33]|uniref:hypothetical protein n=1 Tax=Streptacidiphilus sp. MAP12-33 TaxID=3156266 RepID=UPI003513EFEA